MRLDASVVLIKRYHVNCCIVFNSMKLSLYKPYLCLVLSVLCFFCIQELDTSTVLVLVCLFSTFTNSINVAVLCVVSEIASFC